MLPKDALLIFVAGMATAYVFMWLSMLLLRANQKPVAQAAQEPHATQPHAAAAPQPVASDDAEIALAIAAANRR